MQKAIGIIILGLLWCNVGFAEDIYLSCKGGTSFIIQEHIFTGDVLFQGTVGRTDLPGGDWEKLYKSLIKIMKEIPGHYICHPGHGSSTTIDKEMFENPFLL